MVAALGLLVGGRSDRALVREGTAEALVIVPVSPHMMFSRPVVLAPDDEVTIRVDETAPVASLSLDGTLGRNLKPGELVTALRHERPLKLVRLSGPDFLERLRRKLDLRS